MLEMELKKNLIDTDEDEVLEIIIGNSKEVNSCFMKDVVIEINDIIDCLHNDVDSFIKSLIKKRDDICDVNELCEICGETKIFIPNDSLPQYQSQPVGITRCPNDCEA